jgi:hypothetical protein
LTEAAEALWAELWISLASLLRSYSAAHGLSRGRSAEIDFGEARIAARCGERWLKLTREGAAIRYESSGGDRGEMGWTPAGRLKTAAGEEEMDMAAEGWARELMA